jgi:hypothetical protein
MTCAIHSYDRSGRCITCGHVDEAIRADQAAADARHAGAALAWICSAGEGAPPDPRDAEIARLRVQICRLTDGTAIESDHLCHHDGRHVGYLATIADLRAELAKAREVPPDVEAAIDRLVEAHEAVIGTELQHLNYSASDAREAKGEYEQRGAALRAAIAAEIRGARADAIAECKAARALDVYPAADDAIEAFRSAVCSEALCSLHSGGAPVAVVQASIDAAEALRAIAADKARAVADLRADLEWCRSRVKCAGNVEDPCGWRGHGAAVVEWEDNGETPRCPNCDEGCVEIDIAAEANSAPMAGMRPVLDDATARRLTPDVEEAGQALVDAWDDAHNEPRHRFSVFTDPEGDPEVAAGWMAMARYHAASLTAAEQRGREAGQAEVLRVKDLLNGEVDGHDDIERALRGLRDAIVNWEIEDPTTGSGKDAEARQTNAGIALMAAIAADKARAVAGMRPVLSREDAERLVNEHGSAVDKLAGFADDPPTNRDHYKAQLDALHVKHKDARAALLDALAGAGCGQ